MTMNALFPKPVNGIMRSVSEIRAIAGHCCPMFRNVDATLALCGLISVEVAIYAESAGAPPAALEMAETPAKLRAERPAAQR